jgi:hypothetical protein
MLSPDAALSQAVQFGEYILIPLVSMFGWSATPAYYNIVSGAIDWAHNGGIPDSVLDKWATQQGEKILYKGVGISSTDRSLTYVDDTFGPCTDESAPQDMRDICVIIRKLLGKDAVNVKKTEGPHMQLQIIGWRCDMVSESMKPSIAGIKKIIWWLFKGVQFKDGELKISLAQLRKLLGLLRWYQAVIPFSSTYALQGLLTARERIAAGLSRMETKLINIRREAMQELKYWKYIVSLGLQNDSIWSAPMWFLAKVNSNQAELEIWTDAATSVGGGYHLPLSAETNGSAGHFGQFLWAEDERLFFGAAELETTDINVLEFVTAVLAIVTERETLRGRIVKINVDNTAAISWLNKLRVKHEYGQCWVALLIYVMLEYNIIIICVHIAGVNNIIADNLSRFLQDCQSRLIADGYQQSIMPSTASRNSIWRASSQDCNRTRMFIQQWLTKEA